MCQILVISIYTGSYTRMTNARLGELVPWILLVMLSIPIPGKAASVAISFNGNITLISDIGGELAMNGFDTGATTFSGQISYEIPQDPDVFIPDGNGFRAYYSAVDSYVTVGGFEFSVNVGLFIVDSPDGLGDDKLLKSTLGPTGISNCVGTYENCQLRIRLFDSTGNIFSGTALPDSLELTDFDTHNIEIGTFSSNNQALYTITGDITSLTATVVPLPATAWLLASGLITLGVVARNRQAAHA